MSGGSLRLKVGRYFGDVRLKPDLPNRLTQIEDLNYNCIVIETQSQLTLASRAMGCV